MNEIPTVLAAVDDSDASLGVFRLAQRLARQEDGGKLMTGHAVAAVSPEMESMLFPYACFGDDFDEVRVELTRAAAKRVGRRLKPVATESVNDSLRVSYGRPADAMLEMISHVGPDLVVVGRTGRIGALGGLGAVAAELARRSPVPVAVARPGDLERPISRIIAAVDLRDESVQVLSGALELAHRFDGQVQPIVVVPRVGSLDHAGVLGDDRGGVGRAKKEVARHWTRIESGLELPFSMAADLKTRLRKPIFTAGSPAEKLVELTAEMEADLVVIGRCREDGTSGARLGRVAEYVVRNAAADVLLLPWVVQDDSAH